MIIIVFILSELILFTWIVLFVNKYYRKRYMLQSNDIFWNLIVFSFIFDTNNNSNIYDNNQHKNRLLRICLVNDYIYKHCYASWIQNMTQQFHTYFDKNEYNLFHSKSENILTLKNIRKQFNANTMIGNELNIYYNNIYDTLFKIFRGYCWSIWYLLFLLIGCPIYMLSRIFNILFPFYCLIYSLFKNDKWTTNESFIYTINLNQYPQFNNVPLFCGISTIIYCILLITLLCLSNKMYKIMNYLWHIIPGRVWLPCLFQNISTYMLAELIIVYDFHYSYKFSHEYLQNILNNDISQIIMNYLPKTYKELMKPETPTPTASSLKTSFNENDINTKYINNNNDTIIQCNTILFSDDDFNDEKAYLWED